MSEKLTPEREELVHLRARIVVLESFEQALLRTLQPEHLRWLADELERERASRATMLAAPQVERYPDEAAERAFLAEQVDRMLSNRVKIARTLSDP